MKYDLNVLFVLRKAQSDKKGLTPIYLRITVNGERAELSVNRKIAPKKWDVKLQRAVGRSESARALNDYLDNVENQVKTNFNKLVDKELEISASTLRDMQTGKYIKDHTLISVFKTNNKLVEQEIGSKYSRSTIDQYTTTLNRLKAFLDQQYDCKDLVLTKLLYDNFESIEYIETRARVLRVLQVFNFNYKTDSILVCHIHKTLIHPLENFPDKFSFFRTSYDILLTIVIIIYSFIVPNFKP